MFLLLFCHGFLCILWKCHIFPTTFHPLVGIGSYLENINNEFHEIRRVYTLQGSVLIFHKQQLIVLHLPSGLNNILSLPFIIFPSSLRLVVCLPMISGKTHDLIAVCPLTFCSLHQITAFANCSFFASWLFWL